MIYTNFSVHALKVGASFPLRWYPPYLNEQKIPAIYHMATSYVLLVDEDVCMPTHIKKERRRRKTCKFEDNFLKRNPKRRMKNNDNNINIYIYCVERYISPHFSPFSKLKNSVCFVMYKLAVHIILKPNSMLWCHINVVATIRCLNMKNINQIYKCHWRFFIFLV